MSVEKIVRNLMFLVVSLVVSVASAERHDTKFKAVPGSSLQIRAVEYDGAVNGTLKVQIKNTQKTAQQITAPGLSFVPEGDPDTAPQRLSAVGPTVDVALDGCCIDSQRGSPTTKNVCDVGSTRMPKELSHQIETGADEDVAKARRSGESRPRPAAKSGVQSKVWASRDKNWDELDGEGKQEVAKKRR